MSEKMFTLSQKRERHTIFFLLFFFIDSLHILGTEMSESNQVFPEYIRKGKWKKHTVHLGFSNSYYNIKEVSTIFKVLGG